MKRSAGYQVVAGVSLEIGWSKTKADPNGYYRALGLDTSKAWMMSEIQKAFRVKAKLYHPDGSQPDSEMYTKVQVAYSVLSDPELRKAYDQLDGAKRWVDQRLIAEIVRRLSESSPSEKIDLGKIAVDNLKPDESKTAFETRREFENPAFYYDTDEPPSLSEVKTWVERVVTCAGARQHHGKALRVGFTDSPSFVATPQWGHVVMLGIDREDKIDALVKAALDETDVSV